MEALKNRILQEATIASDQLLKLDSILNHQVDPRFMLELGKEFAKRYKDVPVTKVLTIESSGISVAFATALELGVPLVFARKKRTLTTDTDAFSERVPSFAQGIVTDIIVSRKFLQPNENVLFIDDIIANGAAARGIIKIIERSGAALAGVGVVVEKTFQPGAKTLREQGIRVESLVKIASLEQGRIRFE